MYDIEEITRLANLARARIREVPREKADALINTGALLLDVRELHEYQAGHLSGAVQLNWDALRPGIGTIAPDKSAAVVCYCSIGHRSAIAADNLQQLGYTNVVSIDGGLREYVTQDLHR